MKFLLHVLRIFFLFILEARFRDALLAKHALLKNHKSSIRQHNDGITEDFTPLPKNQIFPEDDYFNRPGPWDDKDLGSLLNANKNWANRISKEKPGFFEELQRGTLVMIRS